MPSQYDREWRDKVDSDQWESLGSDGFSKEELAGITEKDFLTVAGSKVTLSGAYARQLTDYPLNQFSNMVESSLLDWRGPKTETRSIDLSNLSGSTHADKMKEELSLFLYGQLIHPYIQAIKLETSHFEPNSRPGYWTESPAQKADKAAKLMAEKLIGLRCYQTSTAIQCASLNLDDPVVEAVLAKECEGVKTQWNNFSGDYGGIKLQKPSETELIFASTLKECLELEAEKIKGTNAGEPKVADKVSG